MADPIEYEFARIDSKEEIVVYLERLSEPMSLKELADVLHMPMVQLLLSMTLPHNKNFEREMYKMVRARMYDPESPGPPLVEMPEDDDPDLELRTQKVMEVYYAYTSSYDDGEGGDAIFWGLPEVNLYLPRSKHADSQVKHLYARGTGQDRIFAVERLESVVGGIAPLRSAVKDLEARIEERTAKLGEQNSFTTLVGGVAMLRSTLDLQSRHWEAERRASRLSDSELDVHATNLAAINATVSELEDAAWRKFEAEYIEPERRAADVVLALLDASRKAAGSAGVQVAIEMAFERPKEVVRAELDAIIALTFRACSALARSARAPRFARDHVVDMLDEESRELEPVAAAILKQHAATLGGQTQAEWNEAMASLRKGVELAGDGTPHRSVLRSVQRGIRTYRLGLSATSAILEQGVVAQVMVYLVRGYAAGGRVAPMQAAGRAFAMMLLRGLANSAVQHRAATGELFVVGGARLTAILETVGEIDAAAVKRAGDLAEKIEVPAAGAFWATQGRRLNKLQVRPVPRSPLGASARLAVSVAALALASAPLFGERELRSDEWLSMGAAAISVGEHAGRALEFVSNGAPKGLSWNFGGTDAIQNFDRTMKLFAGVAAGVAGVANGVRALESAGDRKYGQVAIEIAGGAGNLAVGIGQAAMGPLAVRASNELAVLSMARWGAFLNAAGVAIGVAVFIAQVVYDEFMNVGTQNVAGSLLDAIKSMPDAVLLRDQIEYVREAISSRSDSMSALARFRGDPSDDAWSGRPTYWKAAKLGFSERAVAKLFGAGMADVGATLVAFYSLNRRGEGT